MTLLAGVVALVIGTVQAGGPFEVGERLKALDVAWLQTASHERRLLALPHIGRAMGAISGSRSDEACQALDEAVAVLEDRKPLPEDAISLRFDPPIAEPGKPAMLSVSWAYQPSAPSTVQVGVGPRQVPLLSGRSVVLEVLPWNLNAELRTSPEAGYLVPVQVGSRQRSAYLSIVRNGRQRIRSLAAAKNPTSRSLGRELARQLTLGRSREYDHPLIQWLFLAEQLESGETELYEAEHLPYVEAGSTPIRAVFPKEACEAPAQSTPVNVVLAFSGGWGSENSFFETYGRGIAVEHAVKRGWAFVSARATDSAAMDVTRWLVSARKLKIGKLFVLGHSSGCAQAMSAYEASPKPTAAAILAPGFTAFLKAWTELPIYMAVGKQESERRRAAIGSLARELEARPDFRFEEVEGSDHLMVVANAIPSAFEFFDTHAKD